MVLDRNEGEYWGRDNCVTECCTLCEVDFIISYYINSWHDQKIGNTSIAWNDKITPLPKCIRGNLSISAFFRYSAMHRTFRNSYMCNVPLSLDAKKEGH